MTAATGEELEDFQLTDEYQRLKGRLHRQLIGIIEEQNIPISEWSEDTLRRWVEGWLTDRSDEERLALNRREADSLVGDMVDELIGFGPIQRLIGDDTVNDILVNGSGRVYVERGGRLTRTRIRFIDDGHVLRIIQRIIAPIGRRVDESSPTVDGRLADGSRVNAIIPPVALDGPCLSIRKFRRDPFRGSDLIGLNTLSEEMLQLLHRAVRGRCNVLVSGGTGAGKTSLLNVLSEAVSDEERIVTIEDTAELRLRHLHVVRLETRPPNLEGTGEITARALVKNALRMRPDRILLGEIRGVEVVDMLQAMNTGHEGSMATLHANSARDCLDRLELLLGFADFKGRERTLRQNIVSSVDLVVQVDRLPSGDRRLTSITEVTGLADEQYQTQEFFVHQPDSDTFERRSTRPVRARLERALQIGSDDLKALPRARYV